MTTAPTLDDPNLSGIIRLAAHVNASEYLIISFVAGQFATRTPEEVQEIQQDWAIHFGEIVKTYPNPEIARASLEAFERLLDIAVQKSEKMRERLKEDWQQGQ